MIHLKSRLNPNSYNLTLHPELLIHTVPLLDMKQKKYCKEGNSQRRDLFYNRILYIWAITNEYTVTHNCVPMLEGRSSIWSSWFIYSRNCRIW